jgi:hypothetical protein
VDSYYIGEAYADHIITLSHCQLICNQSISTIRAAIGEAQAAILVTQLTVPLRAHVERILNQAPGMFEVFC